MALPLHCCFIPHYCWTLTRVLAFETHVSVDIFILLLAELEELLMNLVGDLARSACIPLLASLDGALLRSDAAAVAVSPDAVEVSWHSVLPPFCRAAMAAPALAAPARAPSTPRTKEGRGHQNPDDPGRGRRLQRGGLQRPGGGHRPHETRPRGGWSRRGIVSTLTFASRLAVL